MAERFEIMQNTLMRMLEEKKYSALRDVLITMNPSDIAGMLEEITREQVSVLFRLLPKELAAETFVEMDPEA